MQFFSQFKQDQFLYYNFFQNITNGYFVDIGAYDGIVDSNSLFFEELGWHGMCIEPNPEKFELLKDRRRCTCFKLAIAETNKRTSFLKIKNGGPDTLSGLIKDDDKNAESQIIKYKLKSKEEFDIIDVECVSFDHLVHKTKIDYLSIDTEGNELEILNTIDFTKYDIKAITVENNDYDDKFHKFFSDKKDYKFVTRLGCDEVYIKL
jgi:FkbM family methyltransferase